MRDSVRLPSYVERFDRRATFNVETDAVYIYGESVEKRSHLPAEWLANQTRASFVKIEEEDYDEFAFHVDGERYHLRSISELDQFISLVVGMGAAIYLDVTGLSHHVWAPLVGALVDHVKANSRPRLRIVYVEPGHYAKAEVPHPGDIFDLSSEVRGVRPLPGFARLRRANPDRSLLIALLGFEGFRFHAIIASLESDSVEVIPVIGVPGFRAEYPFYTYEGNLFPLAKNDNWMRRELVTANDPFEVVNLLDYLGRRHPDVLLRIAMVGTKPHALGAVLFFKLKPERCELIYDNPIRSPGRTESDRRVLVYDVGGFVEGWQT